MLVVERHKDEAIRIGDDLAIRVVIVRVQGGKVKVGVAAPRGVPILREELLDVNGDDGHPELSTARVVRHRDEDAGYRAETATEVARLRTALHMVMARGARQGDGGVAATFTPAEWARIKAAMAPAKGVAS